MSAPEPHDQDESRRLAEARLIHRVVTGISAALIFVGFTGAFFNWLDATIGHYPASEGPWPEFTNGWGQLLLGLIGLAIWRHRVELATWLMPPE